MKTSKSFVANTFKIKFDSFDEYVDWAIEKLKKEIAGLSGGIVKEQYEKGAYRFIQYEFEFLSKKVSIDFEQEGNFEWYTGNKQGDPDWVYSPSLQECAVWGGMERLAIKLRGVASTGN